MRNSGTRDYRRDRLSRDRRRSREDSRDRDHHAFDRKERSRPARENRSKSRRRRSRSRRSSVEAPSKRKYRVRCSTTAGDFTIELVQEWSQLGVKRFLDLVADKFFDDQIVHRVMPGFIVQFGIAADPKQQSRWQDRTFQDEPRKADFKHGTVSFAGTGEKDSRDCHVFIACEPNGSTLGSAPHETPIGQVTEGIEVLDELQDNYEDAGYPDDFDIQEALVKQGNCAASAYSKLDRIKTMRLL